MRNRQLQSLLITVLMLAGAASPAETLRGDVRLAATPAELVGDDAAERFGSALDPQEVIEWQLYVPGHYEAEKPAGLLVFISPTDSGGPPGIYKSLLDEHNLIWIGANGSGNRVRVARRVSLALLAAALADREYRIDSARVYVAGFSGGGRTASELAPEYAQLFRGAIYICGVNFWGGRKPAHLDQVRQNRYVFVTGSRDFNRAETRKVHRAYRRADVENVLLLDITGMDHSMPSIRNLAAAIAFLDAGAPPDTPQ